jgi:hypothetical protein
MSAAYPVCEELGLEIYDEEVIDALQVEKLLRQLQEERDILLSKQSQYESTMIETMAVRDRYKSALEEIANHKQYSIDKVYLIHQCECYQERARRALAPADKGDSL